MIRLIKKMISIPMLLLLGILMLVSKLISKLYCLGAGFVLVPLIICVLLAIITTQWTAVAIFGSILAACIIILFGMGWIMFQIETGQEFFKGLLRG